MELLKIASTGLPQAGPRPLRCWPAWELCCQAPLIPSPLTAILFDGRYLCFVTSDVLGGTDIPVCSCTDKNVGATHPPIVDRALA
jgi:hypothetical protein